MKATFFTAGLVGLAAALPQGAVQESSSTVAQTSTVSVSSPEDVPQATSLAQAAAVNVTISVQVPSEILDTTSLNADSPALLTTKPVESSEFLSPADFLTQGLSLDDIPAVSVDPTTLSKRDFFGLFGSSISRGPFVNFLKVAAQIFVKVEKVIVFWTCPQWIRPVPNTFPGWRKYKSNGVNLGGWLVLEKNIQPSFFNDNAPSAIDEDSFCQTLGLAKCGALLENRYNTYITTKDIDNFAAYGVNTLRIPIGYWAYMPAIAGDHYYTGSQKLAMQKIAQYAITKHNMHIVVDLHGLPGGQNGLDNQGKTGQLTWWNNQTAFDLSIEMVRRATDDILRQPNSGSYTISLINEPLPALYYFGQTQDSIAYLNKYYVAALKEVRKRSKTLPVAISDGFIGPQTWDPYWTNVDPYIVIDTHIYFFVGGSYSYDAAYGACYLAKSYQNASNPTFIGEWSIQATASLSECTNEMLSCCGLTWAKGSTCGKQILKNFNHLGDNTRRDFYRSQLQAYTQYLSGGMFWNGKHDGDAIVGDDGSAQKYYWSWQLLAAEGIVPRPGDKLESLC
ncbi:glycoside hydrolase [Aureobasidium subglaciale]|nr:glycoside hydrolase [Aureobasidium subglaciale]KAI5231757.1 glycoside hydrolase [Aureobasidium subglaciale]KAI5234386.1 glycoside hydrolase [Aureobasidium subglaciale]KAI5268039.1 glycoside hydrolase [Aureobasidium subglaciale]